MAAEPDETNGYSDGVLMEIIERYTTLDADGLKPSDDDWVASYDLNMAASEIWGEKAAASVAAFDFSADGATYNRSQAYTQALTMQARYAARRRPGLITVARAPDDDDLELGA